MMKEIEILLVEDSDGDVRLTREALKESLIHNKLNVCTDGVQALDYLYKRNGFESVSTPDLVLLDLNLPKKNGLEVLRIIKEDPKLSIIPIVMLTTSQSESDILRSYSLHANCYVSKPVNFDTFMEIIRSIEEFWLTIVKLPTRSL